MVTGIVAGVTTWTLQKLISAEDFAWEGFYTAVLDSFVISSLFAFVSSCVSALVYAARGSVNSHNQLAEVANIDNSDAHIDYKMAYRGHTGRFEPRNLQEQLFYNKCSQIPRRAHK